MSKSSNYTNKHGSHLREGDNQKDKGHFFKHNQEIIKLCWMWIWGVKDLIWKLQFENNKIAVKSCAKSLFREAEQY